MTAPTQVPVTRDDLGYEPSHALCVCPPPLRACLRCHPCLYARFEAKHKAVAR